MRLVGPQALQLCHSLSDLDRLSRMPRIVKSVLECIGSYLGDISMPYSVSSGCITVVTRQRCWTCFMSIIIIILDTSGAMRHRGTREVQRINDQANLARDTSWTQWKADVHGFIHCTLESLMVHSDVQESPHRHISSQVLLPCVCLSMVLQWPLRLLILTQASSNFRRLCLLSGCRRCTASWR